MILATTSYDTSQPTRKSILVLDVSHPNTGRSLFVLLYSSSSMVSQIVLPLVSGKHITNNPQIPITIPNIPYDRNLFLLPTATSTGLNMPPNTRDCRAIDIAEFLTHVGNNSSVCINEMLNAVHAQKKDTSSSPICRFADVSPITTERMLQTPLRVVKTSSESFRFSLSTRKNVTNEAGSSDKALNVTLK